MFGESRRDLGRVIFVSYSHKDRKLFGEFKTMLAPATQGNFLEMWDDQKLQPGERWEEKIQGALSAADIAVLLVSQHFLASHFITKNELLPILEAARERGVIVFWIYVSSCLYEKTEIRYYQAAHDIARPLDRMKKAERQAALSEMCSKLIDTESRISLEKAAKSSLAAAVPLPEDNVDAYLECCLLISEAVQIGFEASGGGGPTTAVHRKLDLAGRWLERGMKLLPGSTSRLSWSLAEPLIEAKQSLRSLISNAERVLPGPGETGNRRDNEYYQKAKDSTYYLLKRIEEALEDEAEFMKLKNSDRKWVILGFRDRADYDEYL
jgi:hypothetical protein